ncbi:DUF3320 domain-containing protein [Chitinibacteraceae bacterium HSL-7]
MNAAISQKLQSSRRELLDIGLRNNMLNFRKTAKTLVVVDELSEEVFNLLYRQNKSMVFAPMAQKKLAELAKVAGADEADADSASDAELLGELDAVNWSGLADDSESDESGKARRHLDTRLQTTLDDERLFLQLLKIQNEASSSIEEQGVNTLFLALGFLHWYEADTSDTLRKAPLLLLPVTLVRSGARDAFRLSYSGDEVVANLSLMAKLKLDFGLDLAACMFDDESLEAEEDRLARFYRDVADVVAVQKRWRVVENDVALGFFSFGKFLMFKDLDPRSWPEDSQPDNNAVLQQLLGDGFGGEQPAHPEGVMIDSVIRPGDVHFVKDADSSQTEAILEVRSGRNLVIQGPPGTGKSQTITNLVAELIAQGKTVLFVAEKMAALEVVKRRLDECHLGDAVLELHSHKSTKTSVLKELGRALEQGRPVSATGEEDLATLRTLQDDLNRYCANVSATAGQSGLPFLDVLGRYMRLKRRYSDLAPLPFAPMMNWSQADQHKRRDLTQELVLHLGEMGRPDRSVFWGSQLTVFSPVALEAAETVLRRALALMGAIQGATAALSAQMKLAVAEDLNNVLMACRAASRVAEAPKLGGVDLSAAEWLAQRDAIAALLGAGERMHALRSQHETTLIDAAWSQDVLDIRQHLLSYGDKWWRMLSGHFRAARARLRGLVRVALPDSNAARVELVDAVLAYQQAQSVFDEHKVLGAKLFGTQWRQQQSDWPALQALSHWVIRLHDDVARRQLPAGLLSFLTSSSEFNAPDRALAGQIEHDVAAFEQALSQVLECIAVPQFTLGAADVHKVPLADLAQRLHAWSSNLPALYPMARFNVLAQQLRDAGLSDLLEVAITCDEPDRLCPLLDLSWYAGLVQAEYARQPALQQFDRIRHEHQIARFKALDRASLNHAQTELAMRVYDSRPSLAQPGEMAVLRNELNKKRRQLPIRQLMDRAGRAIQQIKPVFMMSPMSIANFLPPGKLAFDVVVFDEASQVKAVDAFGALLRGRQVVVVGDTRQMPPSDFFNRDIELDDADAATADIESILSLFKAAGCQERYLRWHYRSRHESLIAVSNVEFYDSKLVVFPSAGRHPHARGVSFDYLPDTRYDRGRTRTNKGEAKALAQAVIEHALKTPALSLGVAAFSVAQRDLIQVEVELLRRQTPAAEAFFAASGSEPFFVKNLENIQGDERDVIFISVGYGKNESGRIAREFGPLNREGGHRRLNVLITRARLAMRVFCNFRADELALDAGAILGVRALKNFLHYAETRQLAVVKETGRAADSPFEQEVIAALRAQNVDIEPQVGTAGYFIDMAVRDPDHPGRYLLAIECDGASYHSARSARDRDRLRQGVLEGLGWCFHRIWSTDWFRHPEQELQRALAAIEAAKAAAAAQPPSVPDHAPRHEVVRAEAGAEVKPSFSTPYVKASLPRAGADAELPDASRERLLDLIAAVVELEAPVHATEVTRRLLAAFGASRAGARISRAMDEALQLGVERQRLVLRGDFVYAADGRAIPVRSRAEWDSSERKIEWIAPEELDEALVTTLALGFSMSRDEAISGALDLLGFGRATSKLSDVLSERLNGLQEAGRVRLADGMMAVT